MKQIEKIMVPLAFSPFSEGLVAYSLMLAGQLDVQKLLFVSVINVRDLETVERITSFGYEVDEEHYVQKIKEERAKLLEGMTQDSAFPHNRMRLRISVGKPAAKILQIAVEEEVDMIVMGVKAKSEIVHALTGSVAEKLFRRSPVTIVSYRDKHIAHRLRKRLGR